MDERLGPRRVRPVEDAEGKQEHVCDGVLQPQRDEGRDGQPDGDKLAGRVFGLEGHVRGHTDEPVAEDGADEDDELPAAEMKKMKKRNVTMTLERIDGSLGIAVAGNQVTAVHKNGAGEAAGLEIGDLITEVNGKDTHLDSFGSLLPKDKTKPIKLRVVRLFEIDPEAEAEAKAERAAKKAEREAARAAAAEEEGEAAEVDAEDDDAPLQAETTVEEVAAGS
mmetsp:Transcript_5521/g.17774  ORF Transcript_5521/g.17774 Transcript_5521/m.17774 type:complete len:222 (-) Transcript_5521:355-1020(-)